MRTRISIACAVLVAAFTAGCGAETDTQVLACSVAIEAMQDATIAAKCDALSKDEQRQAAAMASKSNGVIVFVPPFESKAARAADADRGKVKPSATPVTSAPAVDHYYVMQDGMKYGYPRALTAADLQSGQAVETLVMALYAGEKDGKHQAHILDGVTVTALECSSPCDYLKIMSYVDNEYLDDQIKVEHVRTNPGAIGYLIMQDAMSGKLKKYGVGEGKQRYSVWVDEHAGMQRTPFKN